MKLDVPVSAAETYRHPQRIVDVAVRRAKLPRGTRVNVTLRAAVELTRGKARGSCVFVPYFSEFVYA